MLKNFFKEIIVLLLTIFAVIIVSILWDKIKFSFENPDEIIGYYSIFNHSYLNDNIRYIFFISIPLLVYFISKIFLNNINLSNYKNFLVLENNTRTINKLSIKYLLTFFFILLFFFLSQNFNYSFVDLFHEGQALSGAFNFKLDRNLWSGSFVVTSLFIDIFSANLAWSISGSETISSYRFFVKILSLTSCFISFVFAFLITNTLNLEKNFKKILFLFLCFLLFSFFESHTLSYREIPIFLFLIFSFLLIVEEKTNILIPSIIGLLPLISLLWSLDRGIFLLASYIPFFLILVINKKIKELLIISSCAIFSFFVFAISIGKIEFLSFISNSIDILSSSDMLNGIIHPTPFSEDNNSTRASKSLIIILLNGIFLLNYTLKDESKLRKNFKIYLLLYYFLSVVFYKIGITRSDGGHIKQGVSLNFILFIYLVIINFFYFLQKKRLNIFTKKLSINILIIFMFSGFLIKNIPKNFKNNLFNFKERMSNYLTVSDLTLLKKDELFLIENLLNLTKNEKCIQVFSYEPAISYYLKKPSCTKFYHIMNMGPKKNQIRFIEEMKKSSPNYIITGGTYDNIGNLKGRNDTELTPSERFPYIKNFIDENYVNFKVINEWKILKKIKN